MIELQRERMSKAIAKAKQVRNRVKMISWRVYTITTPPQHIYTVRFESRGGRVFAACNCAAGAKDTPCYHAAGAAVLDAAVISMRMEHIKQLEDSRRPTDNRARDILIKRDCNHSECKTSRCAREQRIGGIAI